MDLNKIPVVPIEALFDEHGTGPNLARDPRPALRAVDVIFGVDVMSGRQFLVYGRKTLERIARSNRARQLNIMCVALDQDTNELTKLLALVLVVKGRHDYRSGMAA